MANENIDQPHSKPSSSPESRADTNRLQPPLRGGKIAAALIRWRLAVQTAFVLLWASPWLPRMHYICGPAFHCYSCPLATFACPIGVIANFSALHLIPFIAIGTLIFVGAMVGALVCGWACPFGLMQDLLGKIPVPKIKLPPFFGHFRYVVLIGAVIVIPYLWGETHALSICRICPAGAIEGAGPMVVQQAVAGDPITWPSSLKIGITLAFIIGSIVIWRPWCTIFCPLGAIFTLFNRFAFFPVKFNANQCNDCGACKKMCKYRGAGELRLGESQCVRCLDCTKCKAITFSPVLVPVETSVEKNKVVED